MQDERYLKPNAAAIKIQTLIRGVLTRERVKRMVKDLFKRKMIIKQLLDTQENYIRDLSIVISDFQAPLVNKKIISREEAQTIFVNIDQIRRLNQLFFATIFEEASNYWHYKIIFEKVEKEIHFFKLYFEYFNNYTVSSNLIDELMSRKAFANYLEEARMDPHHRLLSLKDYLIKPVQRLPKYVLIMKEIKKRTSLDHPDYHNIERVLHLFEEVNRSNNDKLNRVLNNYKINQIEKKLNLPHMISEPGVQFVLEEPVTVVTNEGIAVQATLYLLNTELIIARKAGDRKEKFLTSVPFKNGGGNIMSNEQHYFYKDTFTVQNCQGDSCMFLCTMEQQRETLIQKIYNELMKAQQRTLDKLSALCNVKNREGVQFLKKMTRLDLLPDIEILGTDERSDNMFKYTVYIIQIRIKTIKQKVFLRFRELIELQEQLKRQYGLTIKNGLFKTPWVTNHKPKRIEQRKIAIQKFLKEILSKQEVIQRGEEILLRLGLPLDFYKLPEYFKDSQELLKKSVLSQRETSEKSIQTQRSRLSKSKRASIFATIQELNLQDNEKQPIRNRQRSRRISIQEILKANQLHLGHFTRYTEIMFPKSHSQENIVIDILIPWIQNEKGFVKQRLYMQKNERVVNLIQNLSKQIGLRYFKDFRVNLEREYAVRILDDDQCLPKVIEEMKCGKYLLIFKKMIYIASDIEQNQVRNDRVRLKIISSQVIYECKKDKYLIDYNIILRLAIYVGICQIFEDQVERDKETIEQILQAGDLAIRTRKMISNSYTSFYDGPNTWKQDYRRSFHHILQKLKAISLRNSHVFRSSGIYNEEKQYNTTQIGQLAAISIIMQMKTNVFFGSISFVVQISQWFRKYLIKFGDQDEQSYDNRNCWFIIKYDSMHLYSISLQTRIFSFTYEQLYKIQPYPSSIILHLRDREIDSLKLKTTNSYSIRSMLLYYKNYSEIIKKIDEDEDYEGSIIELSKSQDKHFSTIRTFKQ